MLKLLLALMALLPGRPMLADSIIPQEISVEEFEKREEKAANVISDTTRLSREYGFFQKLRDFYFYGENGILPAANRWQQSAFSWLGNWQRLLAMINVSDQASFETLLTAADQVFDQQTALFVELRSDQAGIEGKISNAERLFKKFGGKEYLHIGKLQEIIDALYVSNDQLQDSMVRMNKEINTRLKLLEQLHRASFQALRAKIKLQLNAVGTVPLEESLSRLDAVLEYESDIRPRLKELESAQTALESKVLDFAYFQATDLFAATEDLCRELAEDFSGKTGPTGVAGERERKRICSAVKASYEGLLIYQDRKQVAVSEYAKTMQARLAKACVGMESKVNCERLNLLKAIPSAQLDGMDDDLLRFYEYQWSTLESSL